MKLPPFLASIALAVAIAPSANAVLAVIRHQDKTEVKEQEVCAFAEHTHSSKRDDRGSPINGKDPIVCALTFFAKVGGKETKQSVVREFAYGKPSKSCVRFAGKIETYHGLTTGCAPKSKARSVFKNYHP
jgi:hypothetical protein